MSETIKPKTIPIDDAFRSAVIQAWDDLAEVTTPRAVNVEYLCEPGAPLDHVSVWLVKAGGYQDRVCDYWTWISSARPRDSRFWNSYHSNKLAHALEFIMENQERFPRPADVGPHGLVRAFPPTEEERAEAAALISEIPVAFRFASA